MDPAADLADALKDVDAETQAAAMARASEMQREAHAFALRRKIQSMKQQRTGGTSKAGAAAQKKRDAAAEAGRAAKLEAEAAGLSEGGAGMVEDNIFTSSWKATAMEEKARSFVKQHVDWAWALMKPAVQRFPQKQAAAQITFVSPDTEHFDTTFISVLVIIMQGHVWGFGTTDLGGLEEWLTSLPQGVIPLRPTARMDRLPEDPYFSHGFDKGKVELLLRHLDLEKLPVLRAPFWAADHVPSAIVQANALTRAQYQAAFPTTEEQLSLSAKCAAHVHKLCSDAATAREQARVEREKLLKLKQAEKKGAGAAVGAGAAGVEEASAEAAIEGVNVEVSSA